MCTGLFFCPKPNTHEYQTAQLPLHPLFHEKRMTPEGIILMFGLDYSLKYLIKSPFHAVPHL